MTRQLGIAGLVAGLVALLAVPVALADQQITAGPAPLNQDKYANSSITIDQGQNVTFTNNDIDNHNVTANDKGPDGKPLFASDTLGPGQSGPVRGTKYLTAGSYGFYCTLHPFMQGTITVTSAGTPVPRPPSGGGGGGSGGGSGSGGGGGGGGAGGTGTKKHVKRHRAKHRRGHRGRRHCRRGRRCSRAKHH